jgi:hypothetical protein
MALPTVAQLKAYLRVESTAEDAQFTLWLTRATALVEGLLGKPIVAVETTRILQPCAHLITGRYRLLLPWPSADVTVTDADGETVASSTYTLTDDGFLTFDEDATISSWYTVTLDHGWSAQTDYAAKAELLISQAITDTVADWYQRRNPAATSETEASASVTYAAGLGLPARVIADLDPLFRKGLR